jgi:hypothetical protein
VTDAEFALAVLAVWALLGCARALRRVAAAAEKVAAAQDLIAAADALRAARDRALDRELAAMNETEEKKKHG